MSHWLIVALVVVLLFGPKKLGSLGQSLGEGIRGFRDAVNDKEKTNSPNSELTDGKSGKGSADA